ncbi:substrate-binding periplasmic protein [Lacibacterium aquatile]|uniref:Substrate-binding periplasmic protein n=1 Tax=Lacibacterium aquatile TaxID=1168082 RepID=A0ABW5DV83_9PROT
MKTNWLMALPAITMAAFTQGASAQTVTIASDLWCPYICSDKANPGAIIEAAAKAVALKGYKLEFKEIPYTRAIQMAEYGELDIVATVAEGNNGKLLQNEVPFGTSVYGIAQRKGAGLKLDSVADLQGKKLSVIPGYTYGTEIDAMITANPKAFDINTGDDPLKQIFLKLEANRTDLVIDDIVALNHRIKNEGFADKLEVKPASKQMLPPFKLFYAFAPTKPTTPDYMKALDDGLRSLKQSGELTKIAEKYAIILE